MNDAEWRDRIRNAAKSVEIKQAKLTTVRYCYIKPNPEPKYEPTVTRFDRYAGAVRVQIVPGGRSSK